MRMLGFKKHRQKKNRWFRDVVLSKSAENQLDREKDQRGGSSEDQHPKKIA